MLGGTASKHQYQPKDCKQLLHKLLKLLDKNVTFTHSMSKFLESVAENLGAPNAEQQMGNF